PPGPPGAPPHGAPPGAPPHGAPPGAPPHPPPRPAPPPRAPPRAPPHGAAPRPPPDPQHAPRPNNPPPDPPQQPREDPLDPADAVGATQNLNAIAAGRGDDRPFYRDEVPEDAGADTAQFDIQEMDDHDDYDYGDHYDPSAKKRKILMFAAFVVLLLIAGGGTFLFASGVPFGGTEAATVADEDSDPGALEPDTLFPETLQIEDHEGEFTRVATADGEDCATGAHGDYGQVLADNDCRQLVRASYLSEDENHAVTIGVAAMPTMGEAETVREAQDLVASE